MRSENSVSLTWTFVVGSQTPLHLQLVFAYLNWAAMADLPLPGALVMRKKRGPLGSASHWSISAKTHSRPTKSLVRSAIKSDKSDVIELLFISVSHCAVFVVCVRSSVGAPGYIHRQSQHTLMMCPTMAARVARSRRGGAKSSSSAQNCSTVSRLAVERFCNR